MTNAERLALLSPREQAVLSLLVAGKSFKTVGDDLGVAISTVANHASRIYKKLGVFRKEHAIALVHAEETHSDITRERIVSLARLRDWRRLLDCRNDGPTRVMRELDELIAA